MSGTGQRRKELGTALLAEKRSLREKERAKKELQKALQQVSMYRFFNYEPTKSSIAPEHRIHQDGALGPCQQHQAYGAF